MFYLITFSAAAGPSILALHRDKLRSAWGDGGDGGIGGCHFHFLKALSGKSSMVNCRN